MSPHRTLSKFHPIDPLAPSRRGFVLGAAACAGSLIIGARIDPAEAQGAAASTGVLDLYPFIKIGRDNTVTVIVKHLEKGQGIATGLATIVADELDARWEQMHTEFAPVDLFAYFNPQLPIWAQGTGGSTSMRNSWGQMRDAGAYARTVLIRAAARKWGIWSLLGIFDNDDIAIKDGIVFERNGKRHVEFGELIGEGLSEKRPLVSFRESKKPEEWIYIRKRFPRVDSVDKTTGQTIYAMDVRFPKMDDRFPGTVTAVIARPPQFGATLKSFDRERALEIAQKAVPAVLDVVPISAGGGLTAEPWHAAIENLLSEPPKGVDFFKFLAALRSLPTFKGLPHLSDLLKQAEDLRKRIDATHDKFAGDWSVIPDGVAVIAEDTWSAIKGREALAPQIDWDPAGAEKKSTEEIFSDFRHKASELGATEAPREIVDVHDGSGVIDVEFTFPHLAHAPMEPLNAVLAKTSDGYEAWAGSQFPTTDQLMMALALGVLPSKVTLNTLWAGGSFGRRATPNADYLTELAHIVKASRVNRPVHLVWTREDDIKGGRYRPMVLHRVRAELRDGKLVGWKHTIVGQSFLGGPLLENMVTHLDKTAVEGASDMPYEINKTVTWEPVSSKVPTLWWRSVGHTHTAHVVEVMMDVLAPAAGKDPVDFRMELLANHPRHQAVLKCAKEKGRFGEKLPQPRGRGIAMHEAFNTIVAMVADVTVVGGGVTVDRVVAAVDCGIAVNPDVIRAQIEGAIGFGLGAALRNQITLDRGCVQQSNFHDYEPLRMSDMPKEIEVHIIHSDADPTGIGEPGVPPVAPAVANAISAATGKRIWSPPFEPVVRAL